ncbi:bifunctional phosphopantothenoylcysteine decarboxylase/phosphopantothenate--cysteine ligase CoaBC [Leucothrix pacifica]|uniref:Coenzyme A biosynthesis bifunctional protein CoaBC n=1 Tax=Leucothrix pacifica TaxID=1247513 RepID=A0A317CGQ4_9GAMM|nr:bifunctional phosphopantothenoylcysteine decarboxylase/phosphopantothenate--cysteine ligase CoaBC [Leucothrix pacifica]PWQ97698.1 bifunctional phosphopantothenoylcysteine decarboxylase/phosphopantothenate--cysteine ligase CoaBC [Leucothrix pacifica]
MNKLSSKNILVGISGGIAAYKSAELIRLFKKADANVRVCMTNGAQEFITPLTLQALSGNPVHSTLLDPDAEAGMGHIELARWADLLVIAPATADLMARMRAGMADDLLTTLVLASNAPVHIAPAMNQQMWAHPATQDNVAELAKYHHIHGPAAGEQACGDVGYGRMLEPQEIVDAVVGTLNQTINTSDVEQQLAGKRVLITAGPTREPLDPVRYLTNRSSGKMGYAIAEAAAAMGAEVVLVSGPTQLSVSDHIKRVDIETAEQMLSAVTSEVENCDIFIAAAAVADYRLKEVATKKMKKQGSGLHLELEQNPDILATTSIANPDLFTVGFAAETNDVIEYATGKLKRKQLNMIVANQVGINKGFDKDSNQVDILTADGEHITLPEMNKKQLAFDILDIICQTYHKEKPHAL